MKYYKTIIATALFLFSGALLQGQTAQAQLEEGMDHYVNRNYQEALLSFRNITLQPAQKDYHGDAYLWSAKTYIAIEDLDNAQRNLEFFLLRYPQHAEISQGIYLKGRLLFLQDDYESAIQIFNTFMEDYPDSSYYANSVYWAGESLYHLGHLEKARILFQEVVRNHRESFKYEAARYHLTLIDLKLRESELMTLLRWSHEESLKTLNEFQRRERSYEEAITLLRQQMASLTDKDLENQISLLQDQVRQKEETAAVYQAQAAELKAAEAELKTQIELLRQQAAGTDTAASDSTANRETSEEQRKKEKILDLKARTLNLQMELMKIIYTSQGGEES